MIVLSLSLSLSSPSTSPIFSTENMFFKQLFHSLSPHLELEHLRQQQVNLRGLWEMIALTLWAF